MTPKASKAHPEVPATPFRLGPLVPWMLAGPGFVALAALILHHAQTALGAFLGALLSVLYFRALYSLSGRVDPAVPAARKSFWIGTFFRWALAALAGFILLRISVTCLLSALGAYVWALSVLVVGGSRIAALAGKREPKSQ